MILEKRVSRQIHKQPHFKQKFEEKTREVNGDSGMDKSKETTAGKCGADHGSPKDKKSHNGTGAPVAKTLNKPEQTHSSVENSSPAVSPSAHKTYYNPITHVPSECYLIFTV